MDEGSRANYCFSCLVLSLKLSQEGNKNPYRHHRRHLRDSDDISRETSKVPDISENQQPERLDTVRAKLSGKEPQKFYCDLMTTYSLVLLIWGSRAWANFPLGQNPLKQALV